MRFPGADDSSGAEVRSPGTDSLDLNNPETDKPGADNKFIQKCDLLFCNVVS